MGKHKLEESEKGIELLVKFSLAFHGLNRLAESKLGLSVIQYFVLRTMIRNPGCSPVHLAKETGMHASTLTQSLKRLARKTFIYIGKDPRDSRKKILTATRTGNEAAERFITAFMQKPDRLKRAARSRSKPASRGRIGK